MSRMAYEIPPGFWKNFYDARPPRYDIDTTLGMVGFARSRHPYCRWELLLGDIEVCAGADFEGVMFTAHRILKRQFSEYELLAPLRLQVQDVATIVARIWQPDSAKISSQSPLRRSPCCVLWSLFNLLKRVDEIGNVANRDYELAQHFNTAGSNVFMSVEYQPK